MLDIAICDDDPSQLTILSSYAQEYVQMHHIDASIQQFLHPDALLQSSEKQRFHLYVLDIVMPMFNGVEVGKIIREHDNTAVILYTTSEPGFALQSFAAKPFDYLLKPIEKRQFLDTLHQAVSHIDMTNDRTWVIKTHEGLMILKLSEIMCCEYCDHTVSYTLVRARTITTLVLKGSFARHVERLLHDERFVRPHVSYVVNMDHIASFCKTKCTLRNGQSVPIAAKHYAAVRDTYMDYLARQGQASCRI